MKFIWWNEQSEMKSNEFMGWLVWLIDVGYGRWPSNAIEFRSMNSIHSASSILFILELMPRRRAKPALSCLWKRKRKQSIKGEWRMSCCWAKTYNQPPAAINFIDERRGSTTNQSSLHLIDWRKVKIFINRIIIGNS